MVIYSHSRLETYKKCPLAFKYRYIDKLKGIDGIEAFLGKQVHDTLEFLYMRALEGVILELDQTIEYFNELWQKNYSENLRIVKQGMTVANYFEKGIIFLTDYYMKFKPFKEDIIGLEKHLIIDLDGTGKYKLQGFIDKLIKNNSNGIYEVHDYKTNNWLKSQAEVDEDNQLAIYAIGIKDLYPDASRILLKWHFLAHNETRISHRTEEQLEKLKQELMALIDEVETNEEWPAKPSKLCDWCSYNDICPNYKMGKNCQ